MGTHGVVLVPRTRVLLAHQTRTERTDKLLFTLLKVYFEIRALDIGEYHPEFVPSTSSKALAVYVLTPREKVV
jgi:hypothetical protein